MLHEQFEHQHAANTMENERFKLKNAANTVEMAASSSKLLHIAWKVDGTNGNKNIIPKTIPDPCENAFLSVSENGRGTPKFWYKKKYHFPNSNCQGDFPTPKIIFAVTYPIYINLPISNKVCFCLSWLCWLSWWFRTPGHQYGIPALWKQ